MKPYTFELARETESVLVTFDGDSKSGKTELVDSVELNASREPGFVMAKAIKDNPRVTTLSQALAPHVLKSFNSVTTISAGNAFRAAALYHALLEIDGEVKTEFIPDDADPIKEILGMEGIKDILQNDPNVGRRVSTIGNMRGIQTICSQIFCHSLAKAYNKGSELVIVDARDPIDHLVRNDLLGYEAGQISPSSILPIYIETPAEVAASRKAGDYATNLAIVNDRRLLDRTRTEMPVKKPSVLVRDLPEWLHQFPQPITNDRVADPYLYDNGANTTLEHVSYFAGRVADHALMVAHFLHENKTATLGGYE